MTEEQSFRQQVMGRRIQARRERAGWSQRDLGARVGVSQAAIGKWELGEAVPRWDIMRTLAEALGVSPRWLVEPLVVDIGEVQTGEDDLGPGASSNTELQREPKGPHAGEATLGALASGVSVSTDGLHAMVRGEHVPTPAKPTVGVPPPPARSNEERIDRLERQTDLVMDLLHRLRRELHGQRRELRGQRR